MNMYDWYSLKVEYLLKPQLSWFQFDSQKRTNKRLLNYPQKSFPDQKLVEIIFFRGSGFYDLYTDCHLIFLS